MGPWATIDLYQKIVLHTPAQTDQEHLRILIYNNPKIPPRSYPEHPSTMSPLPELIRSAMLLESAGADFIIMPCNTAHIWFHEIKREITIPFYSMIENTVQTLLEQKRHINHKILLLATQTTINHQLYQKTCKNLPFEIITPSQDEQKIVDNAIKEVKAGRLETNPCLNQLNPMLARYQEKGISTLIGGCTEIPLLFPYFQVKMNMIDPTLLLAKMTIQKAME